MLGRALEVKGILTAVVLFSTFSFAEEAKESKTVYVPPKETLSIPAGSVLHMKLTTTLTSKTNKTGDPFTGQVTKPIIANGKEVIPQYSQVYGHVSFVKPSKRVAGKAQMRLVVDRVVTPDEDKEFRLPSTLDDSNNAPCAHTKDEEGTLEGCGKSKKDAAKGAAIAGAVGAGAGSAVGMGHEIECEYYGNCGGPSFGADVGYGAAIGASTALLYNLFKHEKHIILVQGTELTFIVNRTTDAKELPPPPPEQTQSQ